MNTYIIELKNDEYFLKVGIDKIEFTRDPKEAPILPKDEMLKLMPTLRLMGYEPLTLRI